MRIARISGKYYVFVIVNDFSRFTWVLFLATKDEARHIFSIFLKIVQNEKGITITCIRSDHGGEFENHVFEKFCDEHDIKH